MAQVDPNSIFASLHGKISKNSTLVFVHRNGTTHAWDITSPVDNPTPGQLTNRSRFARAMHAACADMRIPLRRDHWQSVATASEGRYKTARGAAFSHYFTTLE